MSSLEDVIREKYKEVISKTDMHEVSEDLRLIAAEAGLGVAIIVAWQHGLDIGHVPGKEETRIRGPQVYKIDSSPGCPYVFVHVPVRQFRGNQAELEKRGIMNRNADPVWYIYHEDGLVGTFSFQNPGSVELTKGDLRDILDELAQQGLLVRANINNRQIQFKDPVAKKRIEESGEEVYVIVDHRPLDRSQVRLPAGLDRPDVWRYVFDTLERRSVCNYCSAPTLLPHEATIHSSDAHTRGERWEDDFSTVRNYQIGFTFAPFGDPRDVCHFLAWDFPHINDLVMNMEPQTYSFSDLIRLVHVINRDIKRFCEEPRHDKSSIMKVSQDPDPISGICNHWAGNTIYHQHYQFFRIPGLPLELAFEKLAPMDSEPLVRFRGIEVLKVGELWPSPAFLIRSEDPGRDEEVMRVADRVAREWRLLSEGEDLSYGNEISIRNHTQNLFVTTAGGQLSAIFIPRHRGKLSTSDSQNAIQKSNAGALEMMGYFVIDDINAFRLLQEKAPNELKALGDSWLAELSPEAKTIQEFEDNVCICLSEGVTPYEEQIDLIFDETLDEDPRQEAWRLASSFQRDQSLQPEQREHLHRELLSAVLNAFTRDRPQTPAE